MFFPVILPYFDALWTFSYIVSVELIGAVSLALITEAFPFLLKQQTYKEELVINVLKHFHAIQTFFRNKINRLMAYLNSINPPCS